MYVKIYEKLTILHFILLFYSAANPEYLYTNINNRLGRNFRTLNCKTFVEKKFQKHTTFSIQQMVNQIDANEVFSLNY